MQIERRWLKPPVGDARRRRSPLLWLAGVSCVDADVMVAAKARTVREGASGIADHSSRGSRPRVPGIPSRVPGTMQCRLQRVRGSYRQGGGARRPECYGEGMADERTRRRRTRARSGKPVLTRGSCRKAADDWLGAGGAIVARVVRDQRGAGTGIQTRSGARLGSAHHCIKETQHA